MADDIINIGGPAPYEKREESPFSSDTSKSLSAPQLASQTASADLTKDEISGTANKAAYDTDIAKINAEDATAKAKIGTQIAGEKLGVDEAHTAQIAKRAEDLRIANDAVKATPAPALFADVHGWDKVQRALGVALAGFADAMSSRSNAILHRADGPSAMTDIINMDLQRQREIIGKLKDNQIMAKEGVKDAQLAREQALARVDLKGAQMYALAGQRLEQLLKAKGVEAPAVEQNAEILKVRRAEQDRKAAAVAGLTKEHTATSAKTETTNRTVPDTSSNARIGVVRNPDGTASGTAPAAEAKDVNDQTTLRVNADDALKDLKEHMEEHGRVVPGTDAYQERKSLFAKAKIAVGSVSALGKSDEALRTEMETLGPPGSGAWAPNTAIIDHVIKRNETNAKTAIQMHTAHPGAVGNDGLPVKPASNPPPAAPAAPVTPPIVPPAPVTPPMIPAAAPTADAARVIPPRPAGVPLTQKDVAMLRWARANPNDPRAAQIVQALRTGP